MDVAGGLSLVQTILQVMDSAVWKEIQSVLGVKSQLLKLKKTMSTIDAVLHDAEEQERLHQSRSNYSERDKLERLKEALYQADDLLDEITTLAHRKKLMPGNNLSKEVALIHAEPFVPSVELLLPRVKLRQADMSSFCNISASSCDLVMFSQDIGHAQISSHTISPPSEDV